MDAEDAERSSITTEERIFSHKGDGYCKLISSRLNQGEAIPFIH